VSLRNGSGPEAAATVLEARKNVGMEVVARRREEIDHLGGARRTGGAFTTLPEMVGNDGLVGGNFVRVI
jgi:hypothetical protein